MKIKQKHSLQWAHPIVREWFTKQLGEPTNAQIKGWPSILNGQSTLISAPTGAGKTLAAFLACLDQLVRAALSNQLTDEIKVLYVSPLKALSNDIQKNLLKPLQEIQALAVQKGYPMQDIRVMVRTGDTPTRERQAMLKKPPHIIVTTPESFYILLTAERSRQVLETIQTIIVDEIHALANNKRGSHLALSLERLEAISHHSPIRIGLSATQKPLELVAKFLIGNRKKRPVIVNIGHVRKLDLAIEVPDSELGAVAANEVWDEIYDRIATLANENRSTLVFVNTRRLAERVAHHLAQRLGPDAALAHHGSLSRKLRLQAEAKLKQGELKVLVATASLELGIDIGTVDLVCQLGSPRAIAIALQRVGRAGHTYGAIAKGRFFVTTRDELMECAALIYAILEGDLDRLIMPEQPKDILAQQLVAACATNDWRVSDLFKLVKKAFPFRNLTRKNFDAIIMILAEGISGNRGRYGAYLFHDRVNGLLKARRGSRLTAIMNGGAIPETGLFTVIAEPDGVVVGTLDEDFAVESNRGDIILLGTTSWQIKRVEGTSGRVLVENAHGAPPSVPFWRGEAPARTNELSAQVSQLRKILNDQLDDDIDQNRDQVINWLKKHCALDQAGSEQLIDYLWQGRAVLGAVPTQQTLIAERFFDEGGGMQLVIHAPFGARINKAWGLALRKCFCRSFNFELQAAATDDGINISLTEQHSFPLADVFQFLHANSVEKVLTQAVLQSPLFNTRWRWTAVRSLALVRFRHGKKVPPHILRMRSDDLLAAVFPDAAACQDNLGGRDIDLPDHPLICETMKEALIDALDTEGLVQVLRAIEAGRIRCIAIDTPTPSTFAHGILNANPYAYLDDAPLEERRARAVSMRRLLPETLQEIGRLDPKAIAEIQQMAWPDARNPDELHDVLQTLIGCPEILIHEKSSQGWIDKIQWEEWLDALTCSHRASRAAVDGQSFWVCAERAKTFRTIYPMASFQTPLMDLDGKIADYDTAILEMIQSFLGHSGPTTSLELANYFILPIAHIEQALLRLEASGLVLRGHFRNQHDGIEWCERRLLARIHHVTICQLRKAIEPVTAAQFMRWLLKWQHVTPGTQLTGQQGLLELIKQLQGFELPANRWERHIFAKRIKYYDPSLLDFLCLTGAVGWGRLTSHPATRPESVSKNRRIMPTSATPITFFVREISDWMKTSEANHLAGLSSIAKTIYQFLHDRGASFFVDIVRNVGHLKSEVESGLWELVAAGKISADSFDNLRALIDPKRRLRKRRGRHNPLQISGGRWSILSLDNQLNHDQWLEALCFQLLRRYGIVFRDLIAREKMLPRWRELLITFRRLEDRGEIRGGRFVSGFLGEQFALPYAVESLRAVKKEPPNDELIAVYPEDPLNLIGIILPGARVVMSTKKKILLQNGAQIEAPL